MKYALLGIGQAGLRHYEAFKKIRRLKFIGFTEFDKKKAINFASQLLFFEQKDIFSSMCSVH